MCRPYVAICPDCNHSINLDCVPDGWVKACPECGERMNVYVRPTGETEEKKG